jgi:hypothetical protein
MTTHAPTHTLPPRPATEATTADADPTTAPGTSPSGQPLTLATLDAMPPAYVAGEGEDAIMGRQLTEQWERVKASRKEDLILGAMVVKVRERVLSARGRPKRGPGSTEGSLSQWLEKFAPTVSRSIAYRLMEIADGIAESFKLGRMDLEQLLCAQVDGLDEKLAKKRLQIEEVIEGKSQRQLLLDFGREAKPKGGDKHPRCTACAKPLRDHSATHCPHCQHPTGVTELTPEAKMDELRERVRVWAGELISDSRIAHKLWRLLPDHEAKALAAHLDQFRRDLDEWVKQPAARRAALTLEEITE